MVENWKPIAGYEDAYEVSDLGRVRSLPREVVSGCCTRKTRQIIRRTFFGDKSEERLHLSIDGRKGRFSVASLVLEAFVGPRPEGMEARHRSDNFQDNSLANLFWGPQAVGMREPTPLTDNYLAILAVKGQVSQRQASKQFKVDPGVVRRLWSMPHT